jgi:hypothetical protein
MNFPAGIDLRLGQELVPLIAPMLAWVWPTPAILCLPQDGLPPADHPPRTSRVSAILRLGGHGLRTHRSGPDNSSSFMGEEVDPSRGCALFSQVASSHPLNFLQQKESI